MPKKNIFSLVTYRNNVAEPINLTENNEYEEIFPSKQNNSRLITPKNGFE